MKYLPLLFLIPALAWGQPINIDGEPITSIIFDDVTYTAAPGGALTIETSSVIGTAAIYKFTGDYGPTNQYVFLPIDFTDVTYITNSLDVYSASATNGWIVPPDLDGYDLEIRASVWAYNAKLINGSHVSIAIDDVEVQKRCNDDGAEGGGQLDFYYIAPEVSSNSVIQFGTVVSDIDNPPTIRGDDVEEPVAPISALYINVLGKRQ